MIDCLVGQLVYIDRVVFGVEKSTRIECQRVDNVRWKEFKIGRVADEHASIAELDFKSVIVITHTTATSARSDATAAKTAVIQATQCSGSVGTSLARARHVLGVFVELFELTLMTLMMMFL